MHKIKKGYDTYKERLEEAVERGSAKEVCDLSEVVKNLGKVLLESAIQGHGAVKRGSVLFQVTAAHTAILAEGVCADVWQGKIGDEVIALLAVCTAHAFVQ